MKRFISALTFCTLLLVGLAFLLFPRVDAKTDPLKAFLDQPAPRPPNPLVKPRTRPNANVRMLNETRNKIPADDAPIEEIIQYWASLSSTYSAERHMPRPSDTVLGRLYAEITKDPTYLPRLLNVLPADQRTVEIVQQNYEREGLGGIYSKSQRNQLKEWLTLNSTNHSEDLVRRASSVHEDGEYLTNHEDLLALTRLDYTQAKPIIDRLYGDSSKKVPQVLARWARYRHALQTGSISDINTYRGELKAVVEDKSATPAMRDLAIDAIAREKEWPGRAEWYFSLLGDETLADIKVNGRSFTGLTTMVLMSPDEKYIDKMLELVKSENKTVRSAAARNLSLRLNTGNLEVLRALLPWLDDPKWSHDYNNSRNLYINKLAYSDIPESVPGFIKLLDEQAEVSLRYSSNTAANRPMPTIANANRAANAAGVAADAMAQAARMVEDTERFPYRTTAIEALARRKDPRAAPPLRRLLTEVDIYGRTRVVNALLACNGFTIQEQLDGLEVAARGVQTRIEAEDLPLDTTANAAMLAANAAANAAMLAANRAANARVNNEEEFMRMMQRPMTAEELRAYIGQQLTQQSEISDELAVALVDRIETIEAKEPKMAAAYRRMILGWTNSAINRLLLRDVKRGIADLPALNRLVGLRTLLREKHTAELAELRSGKGVGAGLASCIFESPEENAVLVGTDDADAKIALFGCARLIRSPLAIAKVAAELRSANPLLKLAAERYLESEDSPEARAIIRGLYPTEVKILGARNCFVVENSSLAIDDYLYVVFQSAGILDRWEACSLGRTGAALVKTEKSLVDEVKKDTGLLAVYSFDANHIRVYKDHALFSWDEDDSRYRERRLSKNELESFKAYLARKDADEMPPYVPCTAPYCSAKELLMIERTGGRRVYFTSEDPSGSGDHEFVTGLLGIFRQWKEQPSTLKYSMSREIPGLEVVFASDDLKAETIWKGDGNDIRIVGSVTAIRKSVNDKIQNLEHVEDEDEEIDYEATARKRNDLYEKTLYEGYGWYKLVNGGAESGADRPPQVDFIPARDGHAVQPTAEQWKARTATVEIRASETGLYKIVRDKLVQVRQGAYTSPVISPDGRWVIASKKEDEGLSSLVRIELGTGKEVALGGEDAQNYSPITIAPLINRALIAESFDGYEDNYDLNGTDGLPSDDPPSSGMRFVDLFSGKTYPVTGEVRPLYQQTFRSLQTAPKPNEYWAAIPDREKNETVVGIYDAKTLSFVQNIRVPKIRFNSMQMWVDNRALKLYFVYRGHVLTLPLAKPS
jgi:HEAT repeat protein